jgi:hypothetical protein
MIDAKLLHSLKLDLEFHSSEGKCRDNPTFSEGACRTEGENWVVSTAVLATAKVVIHNAVTFRTDTPYGACPEILGLKLRFLSHLWRLVQYYLIDSDSPICRVLVLLVWSRIG